MRGHVAKKGNRYYAVIYEGIDQVTGRQRHRWYAGGTTPRRPENSSPSCHRDNEVPTAPGE
jgi:hypothetical protein